MSHRQSTDFFDYVDFFSYRSFICKACRAPSVLSPKAVVLKPNLGTVQTKYNFILIWPPAANGTALSQPTERASQKGMSCFAWLTVCLAAPGQAVLHPASCSGGLPAPRLCCLSLSPSIAPVLPASTCRAESWQTHTDGLLCHMLNSSRGCLRFSHCLCCWVLFFFFSILVFVLFCSPCTHLLSLFLKVLNAKI